MYCKHQLLLARTYILGSNKQMSVIAMQPIKLSAIQFYKWFLCYFRSTTSCNTSQTRSVDQCLNFSIHLLYAGLLVLDDVGDAVHES